MEKLHIISRDSYQTFEDAEECGGVYTTPSALDALARGNISGIDDTIKILETISECYDSRKDTFIGAVKINDEYIMLKKYHAQQFKEILDE